MTRINPVPPAEPCGQHLLAGRRGPTRIPNAVTRGRFSLAGQPAGDKRGKGHVRFFFDRRAFPQKRHDALPAKARFTPPACPPLKGLST